MLRRLLAVALLVLSASSAAETLTGRVIGISDGDTLTMLVADGSAYRQVKIRLAEIDTPESRQPYGTRAKQVLSDLAYNKIARAEVRDQDRYGRSVYRVYVGNLDVNAEMVKRGAAWAYRAYLKDQSLLTLEQQAKDKKLGLWALPEAERSPPWDWRKAASAATPEPSAPSRAGFNNARSAAVFTCGTKSRCSEMTSCEEARFYLKRCGLKTIDGNHDGVPCETLCR